MCSAIQQAVENVLPTVKRKRGIKRRVSEKTKALYETRSRTRGQGSKEQYRTVQQEIRESSLADFEHWVGDWADEMSPANGRGDTRAVYKAVKALGQKPGRPPTNLTTDQGGKTLECAEDVASAWKTFLEQKFKRTDAETRRDSMEQLPCTQGTVQLSEKQFARGLAKMGNNKACGPDQIPAEM